MAETYPVMKLDQDKQAQALMATLAHKYEILGKLAQAQENRIFELEQEESASASAFRSAQMKRRDKVRGDLEKEIYREQKKLIADRKRLLTQEGQLQFAQLELLKKTIDNTKKYEALRMSNEERRKQILEESTKEARREKRRETRKSNREGSIEKFLSGLSNSPLGWVEKLVGGTMAGAYRRRRDKINETAKMSAEELKIKQDMQGDVDAHNRKFSGVVNAGAGDVPQEGEAPPQDAIPTTASVVEETQQNVSGQSNAQYNNTALTNFFANKRKGKPEIRRYTPTKGNLLKYSPETWAIIDGDNQRHKENLKQTKKNGKRGGFFGGVGSMLSGIGAFLTNPYVLGTLAVVSAGVVAKIGYDKGMHKEQKEHGKQLQDAAANGDILGMLGGLGNGIVGTLAGGWEGGKGRFDKTLQSVRDTGQSKAHTGLTRFARQGVNVAKGGVTMPMEIAKGLSSRWAEFLDSAFSTENGFLGMGFDAKLKKHTKNAFDMVIKPIDGIFDTIGGGVDEVGQIWASKKKNTFEKVVGTGWVAAKTLISVPINILSDTVKAGANFIGGLLGLTEDSIKDVQEDIDSDRKRLKARLQDKKLSENDRGKIHDQLYSLDLKQKDLDKRKYEEESKKLQEKRKKLVDMQKDDGIDNTKQIQLLEDQIAIVKQKEAKALKGRIEYYQTQIDDIDNNNKNLSALDLVKAAVKKKNLKSSLFKASVEDMGNTALANITNAASTGNQGMTVHPPSNDAIIRGKEVFPFSSKDKILLTQDDAMLDFEEGGKNFRPQKVVGMSKEEKRWAELKEVMMEIYKVLVSWRGEKKMGTSSAAPPPSSNPFGDFAKSLLDKIKFEAS